MKKDVFVLIILLIVTGCAYHPAQGGGHPIHSRAVAQDGDSATIASAFLQPGRKLTRGVANLTTGWLEIPKQVYEVGQDKGWAIGIARAPFDGLGMSVARTVAGLYEIATFPIPAPLYYQPLLEPAYIWDRDPRDDEAQSVNVVRQVP